MINKIIKTLNMSPLMSILFYLSIPAILIINSCTFLIRGINIDTIFVLIFSFFGTIIFIKIADIIFKIVEFERKFKEMMDDFTKKHVK